MTALLLALALLVQDAPAADTPAVTAPAVEEQPFPAGAPRDAYGLVSWCYGALAAYLDLKPQVMPEVRRIEAAFRPPGRSLAEDLKVYEDIEAESRANLKLFASAISAAEKASPRSISALGAEAVRKGRSTWSAAPNLPKARLAQEWMSWSLPARCTPTAQSLETRAKLLGVAFDPAAEAAESDEPEG